jgi:hypothetical protein
VSTIYIQLHTDSIVKVSDAVMTGKEKVGLLIVAPAVRNWLLSINHQNHLIVINALKKE